jgi:CHAT domain-containing protein
MLADGTTPAAEVLRQIQEQLITDRRTSHPPRWGAFTLVGDDGQGFVLPYAVPRPVRRVERF